ncbi:MAG: MFS transporter, partial [Vicinamibacterales bacterium]
MTAGPGAPAARPGLAARVGVHPAVVATASTHLVVDAYTNIYAPLLPLLIPRLGLSLTMAGTLAMCFQLASSFSQLGWGTLADRWRPRALLVGGPILAVVALSLIGTAPTAGTLAAVLFVGGLGGAAFHPPAAALVHGVSGPRKAFSMSVHISGGSLGFSLAPIVFAPAITALGLHWSWLVALPGLAALSFTLRRLPAIAPAHAEARQSWSALWPYRRPLALLYAIVVLRTFTAYSFATFMPVLLTTQGMSVAAASAAVSLYLFASGVGGFLGGHLADVHGPRRVILLSLVTSVPFLAAAPLAGGWTMAVLLSIGGFLLQSTLPVNVTFGQQLAPVSAATVSSLMMGFAWGTGALLVPAVGMIADRSSLATAL